MENKNKLLSEEYIMHPRDYHGYKWYKPLLVLVLTVIFYLIFSAIIVGVSCILDGGDFSKIKDIAASGYDSFNAYTAAGALVSLGGVAVIIPSLYLAAQIVKDRPFSSYASSRGGWRMPIFRKCLGWALLVNALPIFLITLIEDGKVRVNQFTIVGFILCTILGPLQCIAEEYGFRGFIFQTAGSWFKNIIVAFIISIVLFASMHPYNIVGVIEIAVSGLVFCVLASVTNGLEASSALHITNNMTLFYMTGFGFGRIRSDVGVLDILGTLVLSGLYLFVILKVGKPRGWFETVKKDDVTPFNEKYDAKHPA